MEDCSSGIWSFFPYCCFFCFVFCLYSASQTDERLWGLRGRRPPSRHPKSAVQPLYIFMKASSSDYCSEFTKTHMDAHTFRARSHSLCTCTWWEQLGLMTVDMAPPDTNDDLVIHPLPAAAIRQVDKQCGCKVGGRGG